jgi:hypothetical protein
MSCQTIITILATTYIVVICIAIPYGAMLLYDDYSQGQQHLQKPSRRLFTPKQIPNANANANANARSR